MQGFTIDTVDETQFVKCAGLSSVLIGLVDGSSKLTDVPLCRGGCALASVGAGSSACHNCRLQQDMYAEHDLNASVYHLLFQQC